MWSAHIVKASLSLWHQAIFHVASFHFARVFDFEFCGSENWCL
jgi:hypothetical protein